MRNDGTVYFPTLEAEIAGRGIRKDKISKLLEVDYSTFGHKLNGERSFKLEEAIKIQETFFPDITVNELFKHN